MFAKIFESDPPLYYTPEDLFGVPSGIGLDSLYSPYLVTPPRYQAEALNSAGFLIGAFVRKERTPYSDFTLHLFSAVDSIYFPGYGYRHWWFDGLTGAYLGTDDLVTNPLHGVQVLQMRDSGLWIWSHFAEDIFYEIDQVTYDAIPGGTTITATAPPFEGAPIQITYPLIDRAENLIVMRTNNEAANEIGVYNLTTGALIRRMYISGAVRQIFPEDNKRCYIVSSNDLLNLVDYTTGDVISTLRAPGIESDAVARLYAWDRFYRRILVFTQRADDIDGSCLSTFSGYYPIPLSVGITAPIPLRAPRANRRTPFLSKVYGDAGEAITGAKVTPSIGASQIVGAPPFTDSDGEAIITIIPDSGTDTLVVSADV